MGDYRIYHQRAREDTARLIAKTDHRFWAMRLAAVFFVSATNYNDTDVIFVLDRDGHPIVELG